MCAARTHVDPFCGSDTVARREQLCMSDVAASAYNIRKHFEATTALDGVDFEVLTGEVHALVGENGAGKSTLVRILGGAVRPDEGLVTIGGRECRLTSPRDAIVSGVTTIPQELHLVPALSVAENLALGDPPLRRLYGLPAFIDRPRMREEARAQLLRDSGDATDNRVARARQAALAAADRH